MVRIQLKSHNDLSSNLFHNMRISLGDDDTCFNLINKSILNLCLTRNNLIQLNNQTPMEYGSTLKFYLSLFNPFRFFFFIRVSRTISTIYSIHSTDLQAYKLDIIKIDEMNKKLQVH